MPIANETFCPTAASLKYVSAKDEPEIRTAFEKQTVAVRAFGPQAKELADRYFFDTLVRVHRAGEGAPYTGLQPAGRDLGPAIPAADKPLDSGSVEPVVALLTGAMQAHLRQHFKHAVTAKAFRPGDVNAGREYVKANVEFIHSVERLYEASTMPAHGHFDERAGRTKSLRVLDAVPRAVAHPRTVYTPEPR